MMVSSVPQVFGLSDECLGGVQGCAFLCVGVLTSVSNVSNLDAVGANAVKVKDIDIALFGKVEGALVNRCRVAGLLLRHKSRVVLSAFRSPGLFSGFHGLNKSQTFSDIESVLDNTFGETNVECGSYRWSLSIKTNGEWIFVKILTCLGGGRVYEVYEADSLISKGDSLTLFEVGVNSMIELRRSYF